MKALKILSLTSLLVLSSAFASESGVSTLVSKGEVHVKVTGEAARSIIEVLTKVPAKVTGNPPRHYTKILTGRNISCTISSGIAYMTTCRFSVDADGLLGISSPDKATVLSGTAKVRVQKGVASVTVSGKAGAIILKAMKNVAGHGTMSTTKSSEDISCSTVREFSNDEGSCRFNLDAFGSSSSKY